MIEFGNLSENSIFSGRLFLSVSCSFLVKVRGAVRKGRRDHFRIIAEVLSCAIGGALKTHIMYEVNLSYAQTVSYLSLLGELNLLKTTARGKAIIYETTGKGKSFLERYKELSKLLKSH